MTTDGGGWTALLNPQASGLVSTHPNVGVSATPSTTQLIGLIGPNCYPAVDIITGNGWFAFHGYTCSLVAGNFWNVQFNQTWINDIGATDVMFTAALQGQQIHTLQINGTNIPYDAFDNSYMKCAFWNGSSASISPATNQCHSTMLNVDPKVYNNQFSGNLNIQVVTGSPCSPDCQHGTGYNIQKLFVR